MKKLILLLGITISLTSFAQVGNIKVKITSLRSTKGSVLIYLYRSDDGFPIDPKKAWKTANASIKATTAEYTFLNVPFGTFAITISHDENTNSELDTNFIGIPKEGIGTSNNAKGSFGPPKYVDAKFEHQKVLTEEEIKVSY